MLKLLSFLQSFRQDALSKLQEEMLGRGASRAGQIFPHPVFQVPRLPEFFGTGRLLLQRRRLLLHAGLSGPFRHQVFSLRTLRRRGSGHRSGEDVPQQLLHLRPLQVIAVFLFILLLLIFVRVFSAISFFGETHKNYPARLARMPSGSLTGSNTLFYLLISV